MRPIQKLSQEVIGQIAAGEVVERPASAVKELVENSIDAGATAVTVELTDGGIASLRVSDNGRGIPASQIRMAFERHATSKLVKSDELFDVHTLGFRGEALASIAAVAKVTCTTRAEGADFGVKAQVEAGEIRDVTEAASPVGTTIVVKDLFFNTPVRLKFLKKPASEAALVSDYILRLILSRPDVAFRFVSQGKTVYRSVGDGTLESAIFCVYGKDALASMRHVHGAQAGVVVDGYVGVGELSRGNRQQQSFFVNGRYFRDEALSKALENGCQGWVMVGRFPCCVLSLTVPYRQVDVNVHPNKLEVRFQNHDDVAKAIESLAREALAEVSVRDRLLGEPEAEAPAQPQTVEVLTIGPPTTDEEPKRPEVPADLPPEPFELPEPVVVSAAPSASMLRETASPVLTRTLPPPDDSIPWPTPVKKAVSAFEPKPPMIAPQEPAQSLEPAPQEPVPMFEPEQQSVLPQAQSDEKPLTYIGALFSTYLLFESGDRLLLVDQHAAHERVLYDRFMARYEGDHLSQSLLTPQLVHLTARDCAALAEMREPLCQAGFEVEPFDETNVTVRAVPVILGENAPVRELLLEALDEWQSQRAQLTRERLRRHVMQMACKHAIKGGDRLSPDDVKRLLKEMLATGVQPTCPHGRPIVNELTKRELEKRFKRVQ